MIAATRPSLLLIDTQAATKYHYTTLITLAESAGFNVDYHHYFTTLARNSLGHYDGIFLIASIPFLRNIKHPYALELLKKLHFFGTLPNKCVGLLMPSPNNSPQLVSLSNLLLASLGIKHGYSEQDNISQDAMLKALLPSLFIADAQQGMIYGTSLLGSTQQPSKPVVPPLEPPIHTPCHRLPRTNIQTSLAPAALPYAYAILNTTTTTWFFIGRHSDFTYADIEENFFKNPYDIRLRDSLLQQAYAILTDMHSLIHNHKNQSSPKNIPASLSIAKKPLKTSYKSSYAWLAQKGCSLAWLSVDDFFAADYDTQSFSTARQKSIKKDAMRNGMEFIKNAHYDALWFEFVPEYYFSPHADRRDKRQEFVERVTLLANELNSLYANKPRPKVFLGTNLTSNFRNREPVNKLVDVYGKEYSHIPAPFDIDHFWKPELIDPVNEFITLFHSILPIDGIFLDLEMYHAPDQLSHYSDIHDFSTHTWHIYATLSHQEDLKKLETHEQRMHYLMTTNSLARYQETLELAATNLGKKLKKELRKKIPNALIGAYAMTLPSSWFYRGLARGLSSKQQPLVYATFNTNFYGHADWLTKQKIYLAHGTVLMLSKLHTSSDFDALISMHQHHDFVWHNKTSRMAYGFNQKEIATQYWSLEASPYALQPFIAELQRVMSLLNDQQCEKLIQRKKVAH